MVVLTCITKDSGPGANPGKMDHEDLATALEHSLTIHFMQADTDLGRAVVHTGRRAGQCAGRCAGVRLFFVHGG